MVNLLYHCSFYKVITNAVHNYCGLQKLAAICDVPSTAYSLNVVGVTVSLQAVHELVLGLLVLLSPVPHAITA